MDTARVVEYPVLGIQHYVIAAVSWCAAPIRRCPLIPTQLPVQGVFILYEYDPFIIPDIQIDYTGMVTIAFFGKVFTSVPKRRMQDIMLGRAEFGIIPCLHQPHKDVTVHFPSLVHEVREKLASPIY